METIEKGIIRIPVKNLVISPLNVRKKQGTGIEELAALIAAQGLIHNLVVIKQPKKGRKPVKHEVWPVDGGWLRLTCWYPMDACPKTMKSIAAWWGRKKRWN
jgi:hypothetical protein